MYGEVLQRTLEILTKQKNSSQYAEFEQITTSCVTALGLLSLTKDGDIRTVTTFILTPMPVMLFIRHKPT